MGLVKHPIYQENNEGLQGFHLSAKVANEIDNYDMLDFLLKSYPEYATNINHFNETFLDYLDVSDKLIKLIKVFQF